MIPKNLAHRAIAFSLTWWVALAPRFIAAQSSRSSPVSTGARVRVTIGPPPISRYTGRIETWSDDTLALANLRRYPDGLEMDNGKAQRIPVSNITAIDKSAGHDRLLGVTYGALIGGIGLGAVAYLGAKSDDSDPGNIKIFNASDFAAVVAVFGAIVGGGIGALAAPERWSSVWRTPAPTP